MAIACAACGEPVHELAVKCPHCNRKTGVAPSTLSQEESAQILAAEIPAASDPLGPFGPTISSIAPEAVLVELGVSLIGAIVGTALDVLRDREPELPEAVARRHARPIEPAALVEPDPDPEPPAPGDAPRILK